jgi:hypothetical protein
VKLHQALNLLCLDFWKARLVQPLSSDQLLAPVIVYCWSFQSVMQGMQCKTHAHMLLLGHC